MIFVLIDYFQKNNNRNFNYVDFEINWQIFKFFTTFFANINYNEFIIKIAIFQTIFKIKNKIKNLFEIVISCYVIHD